MILSADRIEPGETVTASVEVTNVAERAGSTVVQVYVADEEASVSRPERNSRVSPSCASPPARRGGSTSFSTCGASPSSTWRRGLDGGGRAVHRSRRLLQRRHRGPRVVHARRNLGRRQSAPRRGSARISLVQRAPIVNHRHAPRTLPRCAALQRPQFSARRGATRDDRSSRLQHCRNLRAVLRRRGGDETNA